MAKENKIEITLKLTKNAEARGSLVTFSAPFDFVPYDFVKKENMEKQTQWIGCTYFGKDRQTILPLLTKGRLIQFTAGELYTEVYNGKVYLKAKIFENIVFLDSVGHAQAAGVDFNAYDPNDIPF